jgi:hypothetical protein
MERQTLQQQVPVYHVCQSCGGAGCAVCADLCIVEGDLMPINTVIGIKSAWQPAYGFIVVWNEDGKSFNKCFTNELDCLAHLESVRVRATSSYMVYPDGQLISGEVKP